MPLPSRLTSVASGPCSAQHAHPSDADCFARQRNPPGESSLALRHEAWGPVFSGPVPTRPQAELKPPPPSPPWLGPGPLPHSQSPVLAPHDLVLVRDELVYVFQIKLVSHGASALGSAAFELLQPPQPQLPPAGNVFPPSQVSGRFPRQQRRRTTAAVGGPN